MSNGNSFSWLSFLLGLAIGLWIAIVALFLLGNDDCDCGPGGTTIITYPNSNCAWVPGGDEAYFCANNDEGGAIVVDEGGAVVVDEGGAIVVDEGGAVVVDEGSAVVVDSGPFAPVPGNAQLGRDRDFEELRCSTNDEGGAIVVDRLGRIVVTSMPNSADFDSDRCVRSNGDSAIRNDLGEPVEVDEGGAVVVDEGGAVVVDAAAEAADDVMLPGGTPMSTTDLAYCTVADDTSDPIVSRP